MKYLFIDTETTGLAQNNNHSPMEIDKWPRLVSVAYILSEEREVVEQNYFLIKPNGFIIPPESTKVHGITTAEAVEKGSILSVVLATLKSKIDECSYIVGHNIVFDINVINSEFYRYNKTLPVSLKPYYCTMMWSKDFCGLPNNKYPKLEELYKILKGKPIINAHNAMADTQAAMECFWILIDSGIIKTQTAKHEIKIYPTKDNLLWAYEHVSKSSYAAKARAFLALAYNLKYNKANFLGLSIKTPYQKCEIIKKPSEKLEEVDGLILDVEYTENDWIEDSFKFYNEEIYKDGSKKRITEAVDNILNEVGGESLINEFQFKKPCVLNTTYILVNETDWLDIAFNATKNKDSLPSNTEINYFKLFIKHLNKIREVENEKERERHYETKEYFAKYGVDIDKGEMPNSRQVRQMFRDREQLIGNANQPPNKSGCMLFLPFIICIGSLCYFILSSLIY